jgi:hypothetical protein
MRQHTDARPKRIVEAFVVLEQTTTRKRPHDACVYECEQLRPYPGGADIELLRELLGVYKTRGLRNSESDLKPISISKQTLGALTYRRPLISAGLVRVPLHADQ